MMAPYIYTERNGIYIIDLQKSVGKVDEAYYAVSDIAAQGGTILFVGNSRFFVDLHDNNTVQILMRTVRLCVSLSFNFCCKVLILFLKTFTSLETNESLKLYRCSNFFGYHLKILSNCLFVLSFYILLL